jgi:hypothetical protein
MRAAHLTVGILLCTSVAFAQSADRVLPAAAETTAEEIDRLRKQKQQSLKPETLPWLHRTILYFRDNKIAEKITYGFKGVRPRFGTLGPGSGFGLGVEYFRPNLGNDRFSVRSSVTGSLQRFFMVDGEFEARRIAGKGFVNLLAFHRFSPSIDFYGEGPNSSLANLSTYALEENNAQATLGWQFTRRLRAGVLGRYLIPNAVTSVNPNRRPVESVFDRSQLPGIGAEEPYVETGAFVELAPNTELGAPPGGNRAAVRWSHYSARETGRASFSRLEGFGERTHLFLNQQRAIVVRARTVLTMPRDGAIVPFYLQPQLGGFDELRGFAGRRFYDNNLVSGTLEYQWQIFTGISLALFADTGKVFPRWDDWSLGGLEHSYGFGVRFGQGGLAAGRFDVAFSREGAQFWVVFASF